MYVQSQPKNLLIIVAGTAAISWGVHFAAPAAVSARYGNPWVPVLWMALGALFSACFWWRKGEGNLAAVCTVLDIVCYGIAIAIAQVRVGPPLSHGFGFAFGLMAVNTHARSYSLSLVMTLAVWLPAAIVLRGRADAGDYAILGLSFLIYLFMSATTGQQRAMKRQNDTLRSALGAVDRIANESMDLALGATLLTVGDMLHELRNLQTVTLTNIRSLRDVPALDPDDRAALEEAILAEERSSEVIRRTLDKMRRQAKPSQEPFVIGRMVRAVATELRDLEVEYRESPEGLQLIGEPEHLRLVLLNLLRNAQQAGARWVRVDATLEASSAAVRLSIVDDGPGLPEAARSALFEPFATFGKQGGTGLGLYLVKRCVDHMGGRIEVRNAAPGGAEFTMVLPGRPAREGRIAGEVLVDAR
ncbi:MAG: sensor histidine kinase [Deltaproteobacteria bacterium]|nr:sensor histidine kinase [Deltaproteobacteria bacterium]